MFDWLYEIIGTMLYWFSSLFKGQYVFGLLIYALLFKLLFLPFSIKQQKNQIKMAELTPKIELIKAKYRGRTDQVTMQKQQQEIMEFQQKEGYNPMAGCLPLLLQMPIIIFLYNVIRNPVSHICRITDDGVRAITKLMLNAGYTFDKDVVNLSNIDSIKIKSIDQIQLASHIHDYGIDNISLEGMDLSYLHRLPELDLFGSNLGSVPSFNPLTWLVIVPVIAAALTWLSMWLTRKWNANPATQTPENAQANNPLKMMDLMMPAMTLFMAFSFSSLMGIYWIYQSALGILQTFIISRAMPLPKYSEEDLKEMRKAQKEAEKAARSAAKSAPKYRSLHYIDDEDYDTLPELKSDDKNGKKPTGEMDIPEI
ncbi:MAG: YidC/Oxa1 family membrane protein insertase [Clostridia bacterium]|nr:YidC/Oxa1 family membrane protein insertase [Clostridia bacterium]